MFNLFDAANFANPVATLPNALPTNATTEANKVQPGQAIHTAAAGNVRGVDEHGRTNRRAGHGRQVQFAFRLNF